MLRALVFLALAALWTLALQIPVTLSVLLTFSGDGAAWMARRLWAPVILWLAGVELSADPLPALDPHQPYVFLSNHQGYFDVPAAYATIPHAVRFVAKRSLRFVPILGWYLMMSGTVLIERSNRRKSMRSLEQAGRKIAGGTSILIYPEGTRSPDGAIHAFKKGPFLLALAAQVPIVPVAIEGSQHLMPKGRLRLIPGKVRIRLGAPIPTAGMTPADRDRLMQIARDRLIETHLAMGGAGGAPSEAPAALAGKRA